MFAQAVIPVPATLLTGFLGSGKSTLLTRILQDSRFSNTAVVVNEFGDVGLDGLLIEHKDEQIVEMTSGCLCCTIRGDIRETLMELHDSRTQGKIPAFGQLVIETTGLADPVPVIHTLMVEGQIANHFTLGGVIATIDAVTGEASLERHDETVRQAAVADRLVLTKTDLVKDPASQMDLNRLRRSLKRLNPGAPILDRNAPDFDIQRLFDTSLYQSATRGIEVQEWLNAEAYEDDRHALHHHHDEAHDINRHGSDIQAYSVILDEPVSEIGFMTALELLILNQGADLLRVKGIVNTAENPDLPLIVHGVQHLFHEPARLDSWPTNDHRTRLVFIARNIPREVIDSYFRAWQSFGSDSGAIGDAARALRR